MRDIASDRRVKARRHTSANRCANDAIERLSTPRAMIIALYYMLFFDTVQETIALARRKPNFLHIVLTILH